MKPIAFSGMMCRPVDITKEGEFRIKAAFNVPDLSHPEIVRYEHFPSRGERDDRYNAIMKLLRDEI